LTDEFTSLTKLSMVNAGLTTLKGFPKLAALQKVSWFVAMLLSHIGHVEKETYVEKIA